MASSTGFEPVTICLEGRGSIQLSYEDIGTPLEVNASNEIKSFKEQKLLPIFGSV